MLRAATTLLVLVSVLASTAMAAGEAIPQTDAPAPNPLADALDAAGDTVSSGASALGSGAKAAGSGLADLAGAIGSGLASLATAVGSGLLAAAKGIGSGLAWLASGLGSLLVATFTLLGKGLSLLGQGLLALGRALATFALFLGGLLASLFQGGVSFTRDHPAPVAIGAGSAAAAGGLAWLLKRLGGLGFLATLYTRLAPSQILDNEARASVYEHVKAHPGAHPSAIAERLDLGWGTVVYHLSKLENSRLVTPRNAHNRKCYFAITADLDAEARTAVAAMSTDKTRTIVETVRARPGISQKELSQELGISQALASWHVKRLVESGVLTTQREGRSNCLRVAAHVPGAVPVAA